MARFTWRPTAAEQQLSAFMDGELDVQAAAAVSRRMALEPSAQATVSDFGRVDALVRRATQPDPRTDHQASVERMLAAASRRPAPLPRGPSHRKLLKPALGASAGLLVTAGVAFIGLRRRGLV